MAPERANTKNKGRLVVLSGPSGVGKTTICQHILRARADIKYSVSATSRPKRRGEENGREYIFLSKEEFQQWVNEGKFVEYAEVHENLYGTPKKHINDIISQGYSALMDVDVHGARRLMQLYPEGIYFFIVAPDIAELERRLLKRNTDKTEVIQSRLKKALEEMKYKNDYEYVIENRDLDETIDRILSIIGKELQGKTANSKH
jgi:guanylate kinase